ncbi:MAG: LysR family transcriptional regulator, partial [Geodermatophilaceae bacterium]|nr:LysR family transcriptional regulator [Geodermatophilaceae bacterium]
MPELRLLVAVIEHRGFSRAGDALGLCQPAISHQIKALTPAIGIPVSRSSAAAFSSPRPANCCTSMRSGSSQSSRPPERLSTSCADCIGAASGSPVTRLSGSTSCQICWVPSGTSILGGVRLGVDNRQGLY